MLQLAAVIGLLALVAFVALVLFTVHTVRRVDPPYRHSDALSKSAARAFTTWTKGSAPVILVFVLFRVI